MQYLTMNCFSSSSSSSSSSSVLSALILLFRCQEEHLACKN